MKGSVILFMVFGGVALAVPAEAQQFRYMDAAGNIFFVDHLSKVPKEYRAQVAPPTPTPVLSKEQQNAARRQARIDEQRRNDEEMRKERERKQRASSAADQRRQEQRQIGRVDDARQLERVNP
jgi:type IV secretory pathway VirB10-like protein